MVVGQCSCMLIKWSYLWRHRGLPVALAGGVRWPSGFGSQAVPRSSPGRPAEAWVQDWAGGLGPSSSASPRRGRSGKQRWGACRGDGGQEASGPGCVLRTEPVSRLLTEVEPREGAGGLEELYDLSLGRKGWP